MFFGMRNWEIFLLVRANLDLRTHPIGHIRLTGAVWRLFAVSIAKTGSGRS